MKLNTLYCEDCLSGMDQLPTASIDMILCDLPYGTTQNKWDSIIPLTELWKQYERIIKDSGAIVLTAQTPFDKILGVSNLKLLRYEWIWQKDKGTGHLNAKKMPLKNHENILVFYKKLSLYNPQLTIKPKDNLRPLSVPSKKSTNYGEYKLQAIPTIDINLNYPKSVIYVPRVNRGEFENHATQKPVALFEYLIKTYTNPGQIVLDNCIGSGTTAIACLNTDRKFVGFENDIAIFKMAQNRINKHIENNGFDL